MAAMTLVVMAVVLVVLVIPVALGLVAAVFLVLVLVACMLFMLSGLLFASLVMFGARKRHAAEGEGGDRHQCQGPMSKRMQMLHEHVFTS